LDLTPLDLEAPGGVVFIVNFKFTGAGGGQVSSIERGPSFPGLRIPGAKAKSGSYFES
jgi:hypothetical protein